MKSTQLYDFTLAANASQVILADANFYKVLTATGDLRITRDGGSRVQPMRAGRGEREVDFQRLTITDISGAANSGTIVVGDSNFIDDTIVLSSAINVRPEAHSGSYVSNAAMVANTPYTIFTPAANVSGAILLDATTQVYTGAAGTPQNVFIAKSSAPTSNTDGVIYLQGIGVSPAANFYARGELKKEQFIPAGLGLYDLSDLAIVAGSPGFYNLRSCRYKLL